MAHCVAIATGGHDPWRALLLFVGFIGDHRHDECGPWASSAGPASMTCPGSRIRARKPIAIALGRALRRAPLRTDRREPDVVFLPRHGRGPPAPAVRHQLPGQYRRAEARGRDRHHFAFGLRLLQARALPPASSCSSTSSSTGPSSARLRSSARVASRMCRWRIRSGRRCRRASPRRRPTEGVAGQQGGTYVCMEGPAILQLCRIASPIGGSATT